MANRHESGLDTRRPSAPSSRTGVARALTGLAAATIGSLGGLLVSTPDAWGGLAPPEQVFLYDVTFRRPDLHWANADAALAYGYGICDKIRGGQPYAQIAGDFKVDLQTADEYLASYVISDAAEQLCPELIWQLRNGSANYMPPPPQ
jgi:hypothetical protein